MQQFGKPIFFSTLTLLAIVSCILAGRSFIDSLETVELVSHCGEYDAQSPEMHHDFEACLRSQADRFLRMDYPETKDLIKSFLTLLTAVLVASITFSEKIVDVHRSGWWARGLMISSWVLLLVAIISSGTALAMMVWAAGIATYDPHMSFWKFEGYAVYLGIAAGLSFGSGLVSLLLAGVISLVDRSDIQNLAVISAQKLPEPVSVRSWSGTAHQADKTEWPGANS